MRGGGQGAGGVWGDGMGLGQGDRLVGLNLLIIRNYNF